MGPSYISNELKRIAAAIQQSKNPSREKVVQELKRIMATMKVASVNHMMVVEAAAKAAGEELDMNGKIVPTKNGVDGRLKSGKSISISWVIS